MQQGHPAAVYFYRVDLAVEIYGKPRYSALSYGRVQVGVEFLQFGFKHVDIDLIRIMTLEYPADLGLDLTVGRALQTYPYGVVPVGHLQ